MHGHRAAGFAGDAANAPFRALAHPGRQQFDGEAINAIGQYARQGSDIDRATHWRRVPSAEASDGLIGASDRSAIRS